MTEIDPKYEFRAPKYHDFQNPQENENADAFLGTRNSFVAFSWPGLMSSVRAAVRVSLDKTTMWDDPTLLSPNTLASLGSDLRYTETDFSGATPKRSARKSGGARRRPRCIAWGLNAF